MGGMEERCKFLSGCGGFIKGDIARAAGDAQYKKITRNIYIKKGI